ncbi:sigma 54-interacting transcriptional regulator [Chromobacterium haemolyticum]|uniref:sigma 54-interacting transcriptional regulator n=1 Tax=Chromobacterium haemolyticum TaxID=394935 RepID=UPI0009D92150|nr:sigma 54-interacting transcriptional regulator [Chromobacterium haemolyticum]OQS38966.1 two-component system response regulator GlrR [Chromobacterium haemolyticum]PTU72085.1 two-component system response regulator GlrR [Chromobacterium haemolyticum]UGA36052.1 sigma 54-interacting transcriptional regulator [Chromobacterium haemolyticum]
MSAIARIVLVDDDPDLLRLLGLRLGAAGYEVEALNSAEAALNALAARRADLLLTDWRLPGMDGLELFEQVRQRYPAMPVILLTAHGTVPDAVEAVSRGVFGYLVKPFDGKALLHKVAQGLSLAGPGRPVDQAAADWRSGLVSRSPAMEELLAEARMVAATGASVLLRGESGTGKEVLAKAIHLASPRAGQAFIAVNCGAIPDNLLESELFGHEKGSFTGANARQTGLIQQADGGTLFLDEIGDMPPPLQVKLLRVLQEREVRPVGATRATPVDIRLVSATHRELEALIQEGSFREDLFYRLNVVSLRLPPLAERREDIPLLAAHFLEKIATRYQKAVSGFAADALEYLSAAPWPGNIRQLANVVEQCCVLTTGSLVTLAQVQKAVASEESAIPTLAEAKRQFERDYLERLLRLTGGNVSDAARLADRNRTEFYRLLQKHELTPAAFKLE